MNAVQCAYNGSGVLIANGDTMYFNKLLLGFVVVEQKPDIKNKSILNYSLMVIEEELPS